MPSPTTTAAVAYSEKGDYDRAIADYDRAINLEPEDADAYANRGSPTTPRATMTAPSPTSTRPSSSTRTMPCAYANRGLAYNDKGDYDRAIADFDKAIQLEPEKLGRIRLSYNDRWPRPTPTRATTIAPSPTTTGHPAQAGLRRSLRRPRLGLQRQGRLRPRHS